ncbi:hypothetical protein AVEN_17985-1 [Araneus ventricosus]|uniref:Uncharacterized protein n=1 Tax=Araneus ventricosus TaxID=182803 RepID=A0A4Y2LR78_ARAVE|nr:hypothetical protein AVEN_17985-1 [Araneus ventricosus]
MTYNLNEQTVTVREWATMLSNLKRVANRFLDNNKQYDFGIVERLNNGLNRKRLHMMDDLKTDQNCPQIMFAFGTRRPIIFKKTKIQKKSSTTHTWTNAKTQCKNIQQLVHRDS